MDREDARFVANALSSRIIGARAELEQLAASSLMRLSAIASTIERTNKHPNFWPAAATASLELMAICRLGGKLAAVELQPDQLADLEAFTASMNKLAEEPGRQLNRAERRARTSKLKVPRRRLVATAKRVTGLIGIK